jgi:D-alanyl-D-alanine carboxypeptidase
LPTHPLTALLGRYAGSRVPGLQYLIVTADATRFEYAGGWADIRNRRAMTLDTTMMAYSMTKTFTAVAVLQLVGRGTLGLDDTIGGRWTLPVPGAAHITVRELLDHTSGLPNPIPLRWVHLADEDATFDEDGALSRVFREHPKLQNAPGRKFAYSNLGYWFLGKIVEQATGRAFRDYVKTNVLEPLGLSDRDLGFGISNPERHANGYLAKYSLMNLIKGFLTDRKFWGAYEGRWFRFQSHYPNGPAFGGLVGTGGAFSRFLQDQLRADSVLLGREGKRLLETQQLDGGGRPIPMTLGWHLGETSGTDYLFKEGGGGGFHSEMRLYPAHGIGSVVMANDTEFQSTKFLNRFDRAFLEGEAR